MKSIWQFTTAALAAICIFLFISKGCSERKSLRDLQECHRAYNALEMAVAHPRIDTVFDTIYVTKSATVRITERDTVRIDTPSEAGDFDIAWANLFRGDATTEDFKLNYEIITTGDLQSFTIPSYELYRKTITQTISTPRPIEDPAPPRNRSTWWAYGGAGLVHWSPATASAGVMYLNRNGWGIGLGAGYADGAMLDTRVMFRLSRNR